MTGRVVVGFDGSPAATAALRWAADEARLRRAPLVAYTITGHHGDAVVPDALPPQLTGGYPVSVQREPGDTATCLRAACTPADLLVLGTRARPTLSEVVLGSVSRACLTHAPCPVVVIRAQEQLRRIRGYVITGVRSSAGARHILVTAAREARLRAGALVAVHARPLGNVDAQVLPAAMTRLLEQGHEWLAAQLAATAVHAIPQVVVGGPVEALLRYSAHGALLVMGAHESSAPWGGVPGATITHCIRHAQCPVMVVPDIPGSPRVSNSSRERDQQPCRPAFPARCHGSNVPGGPP